MTDDDRFQQLRVLEAMIFASAGPVPEAGLAARLPEGANLHDLLNELTTLYANRGVNLVHLDDKWAFRTAPDLGPRLQIEQPVTRAEVEEVRGVALSKGTLDTLLEIGWVRPKGRRRTPGRPVTWVTTVEFLDHFGLESLDALPGVEELKAAGLLDVRSAISSLGAQALADTARPANHDGTDSGQTDEDEAETVTADALDEAALGELPEED